MLTGTTLSQAARLQPAARDIMIHPSPQLDATSAWVWLQDRLARWAQFTTAQLHQLYRCKLVVVPLIVAMVVGVIIAVSGGRDQADRLLEAIKLTSPAGKLSGKLSQEKSIHSTAGSHHHCGCCWQREYAALHRNILQGKQPPRYAAVYCDAGLADCLRAFISIFYYALLTGRAFQVPWAPTVRKSLHFAHMHVIQCAHAS